MPEASYKASFIDEDDVECEGYVAKRNIRIIHEKRNIKDDEDLAQEDSSSDNP